MDIQKYKEKHFWFKGNTNNFLNNNLINFFLNTKKKFFIFKFPRVFFKKKKNEKTEIAIKKYKKNFLFGHLIFFKSNFTILYYGNFKYEIAFASNPIQMNLMGISFKHKILLFLGLINYIFYIFPILY